MSLVEEMVGDATNLELMRELHYANGKLEENIEKVKKKIKENEFDMRVEEEESSSENWDMMTEQYLIMEKESEENEMREIRSKLERVKRRVDLERRRELLRKENEKFGYEKERMSEQFKNERYDRLHKIINLGEKERMAWFPNESLEMTICNSLMKHLNHQSILYRLSIDSSPDNSIRTGKNATHYILFFNTYSYILVHKDCVNHSFV